MELPSDFLLPLLRMSTHFSLPARKIAKITHLAQAEDRDAGAGSRAHASGARKPKSLLALDSAE